jgi:hypothetical protein
MADVRLIDYAAGRRSFEFVEVPLFHNEYERANIRMIPGLASAP